MPERTHLVEQHIIGRDHPVWSVVDAASFAAKNIYNAANYRLRQEYIQSGRYISYDGIEKEFKQPDLLADQQLPSKVVQQVLRQLDGAWQSFFAARTEYDVHPEKFKARPCLPRYKHKTEGRSLLVYTAGAYFKRDLAQGRIRLSGLGVVARTKQGAIEQVRIVPHKTHYTLEVVYCQAVKPAENLNPALIAGGDLGIDTLLALTSNQPGFVPLLVSGRPLKAIN